MEGREREGASTRFFVRKRSFCSNKLADKLAAVFRSTDKEDERLIKYDGREFRLLEGRRRRLDRTIPIFYSFSLLLSKRVARHRLDIPFQSNCQLPGNGIRTSKNFIQNS